MRQEYDVTVVGAGIGGLTAASYLAKAGLRILLIDRHYAVGGYASSFRRGGYYFDVGAHYFGSCRPNGHIGKILLEHDLNSKKVEMLRIDPSDVLISEGKKVWMYTDYNRLVAEYQSVCPDEAHKVKQFMDYMSNSSPLQLYAELHGTTFEQLLGKFFKSSLLKSFFSMPLGNVALPSTRVSALTAVLLYREFIFDGGYYPRGGMQSFSNALMEKIREYGGDVELLTPATSIDVHRSAVRGITFKRRGRVVQYVKTKTVVAACDFHGLVNMLPAQIIERASGVQKRLSNWVPSASAFMVYLGIRGDLLSMAKYRTNVWYYPKGHVDEYYNLLCNGEIGLEKGFVFYSTASFHDPQLLPEGMHSIQAIVGAPYRTREFWEHESFKDRMADEIISRIEQFIPGLGQHVEMREVAIPPTLEKYTGNYRGAMYGWESSPEQTGIFDSGDCFGIDGLYLVGHWADLPTGRSGIAAVAAAGRRISRVILRSQARSKGTNASDRG